MTRFKPECVLVTGGAGFIGSNFIRWLLAHDPRVRVVNFDLLTYAGNLESLDDVVRCHGAEGDGRYWFRQGDIRDFDAVTAVLSGRTRETPALVRAGRRTASAVAGGVDATSDRRAGAAHGRRVRRAGLGADPRRGGAQEVRARRLSSEPAADPVPGLLKELKCLPTASS